MVDDVEKVPTPQKFLDNMWLLLILSQLILFVSYALWGIWDVLNLP